MRLKETMRKSGVTPEDRASPPRGRAGSAHAAAQAALGAEGKTAHFSNSGVLISPTLRESSIEDQLPLWRWD